MYEFAVSNVGKIREKLSAEFPNNGNEITAADVEKIDVLNNRGFPCVS